MNLMVKFFGICQGHFVLHRRFMSDTHEIVIPGSLAWHHKEPQKSITQKHLNFLVMAWQVPLGIVTLVRVILAPFKTRGRQLVSRQ